MGAKRAIVAAAALVAGLTVGMTGCGSTGLGSSGSSLGSAGSTSTENPGAAGGSGACGGKAVDLDSALRILTDPVGCPGAVNTFWRNELGSAWTAPRFLSYQDGQVPADACGRQVGDPKAFQDNALYCSLDDTVAFSTNFMQEMTKLGGPTFPLFVLMHELGHRADRIGNTTGAVSLSEENQADCDAGLTTRFADKAKRLNLSDAFGGAKLFFSLGDTRGGWFRREAGPNDTDAHGSPIQRAHSFANGYLRSVDICRRTGASSSGSVPLI
jgi:predicted metalloprotease